MSTSSSHKIERSSSNSLLVASKAIVTLVLPAIVLDGMTEEVIVLCAADESSNAKGLVTSLVGAADDKIAPELRAPDRTGQRREHELTRRHLKRRARAKCRRYLIYK